MYLYSSGWYQLTIKKYIFAALVLLFASMSPSIVANATTCYLDSEVVSGDNRICYYDCMSGSRAITVNVMDFCPLTMEE